MKSILTKEQLEKMKEGRKQGPRGEGDGPGKGPKGPKGHKMPPPPPPAEKETL